MYSFLLRKRVRNYMYKQVIYVNLFFELFFDVIYYYYYYFKKIRYYYYMTAYSYRRKAQMGYLLITWEYKARLEYEWQSNSDPLIQFNFKHVWPKLILILSHT